MDSSTLLFLSLVFIATLIRSTFGFGEAVVLVPLLAYMMPITTAAPMALMLSVTIAISVIAQDWKVVRWKAAGWLLLAALAGIPVGSAMLTSSHENMVKAGLGSFIVLFAGYSVFVKHPIELIEDNIPWMLAIGFGAGILGGAYGMFGPLVVVYGAMRRWNPKEFRATIQGYSLPASSVGLMADYHKHLMTSEVLHLYTIALITAIPAIVVGSIINHRLKAKSFGRFLYVGLIVVGLGLIGEVVPKFIQRLEGRSANSAMHSPISRHQPGAQSP